VIGRREVIIMTAGAALTACSKNIIISGESDMSSRFEQFKTVIEAWKNKDIDAVIDAMSDDIVWHYAAAIAPPVRGKKEARAFLERFGGVIGEVKWRIFETAETADRLFVEGVDEYVTKDGVAVAAPYAGVIEYSGDKISGWRDYVDSGAMSQMKAGNPYPEQVKELIARPAR
tara:strand:- start:9720 stop:10238 length:519 start_codon:yes stop_codon:yes gene_type:complete